MNKLLTLPQIINFIDSKYNHSDHFNFRKNDRWVHISTKEFSSQIRSLTLALESLGIQRNDGFAIMAKPSPIWMQIDLAIISSGAISVPIFPDISHQNLLFEVDNAEIKFVFCDSLENLQILLESGSRFKKIITYGFEFKGDNLISFEDLLRLGDDLFKQNPQKFNELATKIKEDDLATIIYTSGSTGIPKGVEITHKNLISQIYAAQICFPLSSENDVALSFLPLAHVFERMIIYFYIFQGIKIYFADDVKNVGNLLKEVNPTLITVVPRLLEKVFAKMQSAVLEANFIKKFIGKSAFFMAPTFAENFIANNHSRTSIAYKIFNRLVYKKLRAAFGGKMRMVISGGAPLSHDLESFFLGIGITLYVGYGTTESSPVIAVNYKDNIKLGTIGKAFPGVMTKISSEGELMAKGDNIMRGYHKDPEKTKDTITPDGWLHTGDLAKIDSEGYIKIIGRSKEMFKTATGKYVSPVPIEQKIMSLWPLLSAVCIVAENKKFVSCLFFPDFDVLEKYKAKSGFENLSDEEFLKSDFIQKTAQNVIDKVNEDLNHWEKIQKFYVHKEPISIRSGELTPSMKIKRGFVEEKFADIINEFYK